MKIYEKEIKREDSGASIAKFVIFSETPSNMQPQDNVQAAVGRYVKSQRYYDFVEEWLDNPWLRVVFLGLENIPFKPYYGLKKFEQTLVRGNIYTESKLIILWDDTGSKNPKPIIEGAIVNIVNGASYNAFVLSSLNNPWIKVVITGIDNLKFKPFNMR